MNRLISERLARMERVTGRLRAAVPALGALSLCLAVLAILVAADTYVARTFPPPQTEPAATRPTSLPSTTAAGGGTSSTPTGTTRPAAKSPGVQATGPTPGPGQLAPRPPGTSRPPSVTSGPSVPTLPPVTVRPPFKSPPTTAPLVGVTVADGVCVRVGPGGVAIDCKEQP